ncbi:hypothetical protein CKM354_000371600 [Cercospora kikuchii]|uniref:Uncharacterized protein n=1 Tax=Cercospora kikuchii TaxID=84275 RepID=A0A9P3CID3_9PEZI|nr:uncharacterized protein CKM354_000371600 [Cercospora kikuchii]GIZ40375.1 hypothetical protein CKM354_000371600 [Cercospora kikuchii]
MSGPLPPVQTRWLHDDEKPLPQLPSPTLSNIDMVLPMNSNGASAVTSPPRAMQRPPSPSYLRDTNQEHNYRAGAMGKKEKLGLMSRKMMLLRSRTGSNGGVVRAASSQSQTSIDFVPSSPVLQDVGNLAPEKSGAEFLQLPEKERRRASGSSSSGLSGMTAFLEKYGKASDEDTLYDSSEHATPARTDRRTSVDVGGRPSLEEDPEEMRRRQQQEEYESAILSKRAEEILANAKKRLNVMEGNLRGARDLVQPLTAANLKRATSMSGAIYGNGRTLRYDYDDEQTQSSPRRLHSQHSSPQMNHDYQTSDRAGAAPLPDRPYTSLDIRPQYMATPPMNLRNPLRSAQQTHERNLRSTRSHDQLMTNGSYSAGRSFYSGPSPIPDHLEPLTEDEERHVQQTISHTPSSSINNGLGIYRPSSRTSELRDQMSSLKGKISTLKERAREDSLRRNSQSNLRHQSPFNNAATTPPEMFYTPPATDYSIHQHASTGNSPALQTFDTFTGSRNAFAEQEYERARRRKRATSKTIESKTHIPLQLQGHRRTASGTAIVESAKNRYSHHQHNNSSSSQVSQNGGMVIDLPSAHMAEHEYLQVPQPNSSSDESPQSSSDEAFPRSDEEYEQYEPSEADASVYEDAKEQMHVVAHEDREDAFDYEHFFLHSAMGNYSTDRRDSQSSVESEDSVETARGPALVGYDEDDEFDQMAGDLPPTPQTPERLREIERNLHVRSRSTGSATTMHTFATAHEEAQDDDEEEDEYEEDEEAPEEPGTEPVSPMEEPVQYNGTYSSGQRSVSPLEPPVEHHPRTHVRAESYTPQASHTAYHTAGRYQRNVQSAQAIVHPDTLSERADSGVSITSRNDNRRQQPPTSMFYRHGGKLSNASAISTPPLSPHDALTKMDPTTIAVQALLDPNGRQLGLRNKAVLFGVVESLRKIVRQMQEEDDATFASRMLRNTLDEAKRTLDGL